jgi:hypothetical protein
VPFLLGQVAAMMRRPHRTELDVTLELGQELPIGFAGRYDEALEVLGSSSDDDTVRRAALILASLSILGDRQVKDIALALSALSPPGVKELFAVFTAATPTGDDWLRADQIRYHLVRTEESNEARDDPDPWKPALDLLLSADA